MATKRFLIDYLPPYMQKFLEIKELMATEQIEIDEMWSACENALADQFIMDATESGIKRWENMLGITPKATDTLDERRFRILTRLNQELPYTVRKLEEALIALCGADGFAINLQANQYHIEVRLALNNQNNYEEIESLLDKMIPANMTKYIQIMFVRHDALTQFSHSELSSRTHNEIKSEVFN